MAPKSSLYVRGSTFASYVPVPVDVQLSAPSYTPDLDQVVNPEVLAELNDAQRAALQENGFVVVFQPADQVYSIYQEAQEAGRPVFVTSDAVLQSFHILYDYSLRLTEMDYLIGDLRALTAAMLAQAEADYAGSTAAVQEPAQQELAFFAVAARLLSPDAAVPESVQKVVEDEVALIDAHSGITSSPIFGYKEDYSQYVPRGHYTRNEEFQRYFQAMMWYGRMSFHLSNPEDPAAARRETRSALLIVRNLSSIQAGSDPAMAIWDRIYEPTAFFVGTADDLTVRDYATVAQQVYGGLPDISALADDARLDAFVEAARQLRPPTIVGGEVSDRQDPQVVTMGLRFMGQRFIPDSYMFQQLVYDLVPGKYLGSGTPFTASKTEYGTVRGFPRGLDIPAVLGSDRALEILRAEGDADYEGYAEQLQKLQGEFAAMAEEQWTSNLYWNWLYTLQPLLQAKGEGYPYFMQSAAWVDKDLHSWLGSWAELRHDTILYAKQSYTQMLTAVLRTPEPANGYVEPQPELYARLAALAAQMRDGLESRGLLGAEMARKLDDMEQLQLTLKTISEKELRGEGLTEDEYAAIRTIGDTLEGLTTFSEQVQGEITSQADERMALIADVHTDPNTSRVLEEGVGDALTIYVVVLIDGEQVVTEGGVFSYYEFKQPMGNRLTDEAWQSMSSRPAQPAWTGSFIIQ